MINKWKKYAPNMKIKFTKLKIKFTDNTEINADRNLEKFYRLNI